jgi:hypothetical protein
LVTMAAVALIAWSAPAWAVLTDTVATSKGEPVAGKSLTITFKDKDNTVIGKRQVKTNDKGQLKVDVPDKAASADVQSADKRYEGHNIAIKDGKFESEIKLTETPAAPQRTAAAPKPPFASRAPSPQPNVFGGTGELTNNGFPPGFFITGEMTGTSIGATATEFTLSGIPSDSFRFNSVGIGGGGSVGFDGITIFGVPISPFASAEFMDARLAQGFSGGFSFGEDVRAVVMLGTQVTLLQGPDGRVYAVGAAAAVEKRLFFNFATSATNTQWAWGPAVGLGVSVHPVFLPPNVWLFAEGDFIFPEQVRWNMPAPSPSFNYTYNNQIFMLRAGVKLNFSASDVRLKRDITFVNRLDNGLNLYRYRYLWSDQEYVGVMAQEVAQIMPDAVMMGPDGYLRVSYAKLGTHLMTLEEWQSTQR